MNISCLFFYKHRKEVNKWSYFENNFICIWKFLHYVRIVVFFKTKAVIIIYYYSEYFGQMIFSLNTSVLIPIFILHGFNYKLSLYLIVIFKILSIHFQKSIFRSYKKFKLCAKNFVFLLKIIFCITSILVILKCY